jgi:hypothetical protein
VAKFNLNLKTRIIIASNTVLPLPNQKRHPFTSTPLTRNHTRQSQNLLLFPGGQLIQLR